MTEGAVRQPDQVDLARQFVWRELFPRGRASRVTSIQRQGPALANTLCVRISELEWAKDVPPDSPDSDIAAIYNERFTQEARASGLGTLDAYHQGLLAVREQLRTVLPLDKWNMYFNKTGSDVTYINKDLEDIE